MKIEQRTFEAKVHLCVNGLHVYPNTRENVKAGLPTRIKLTADQAQAIGPDLIPIDGTDDSAPAVSEDKQLRQMVTK